jgi:hypothetical protein
MNDVERIWKEVVMVRDTIPAFAWKELKTSG